MRHHDEELQDNIDNEDDVSDPVEHKVGLNKQGERKLRGRFHESDLVWRHESSVDEDERNKRVPVG